MKAPWGNPVDGWYLRAGRCCAGPAGHTDERQHQRGHQNYESYASRDLVAHIRFWVRVPRGVHRFARGLGQDVVEIIDGMSSGAGGSRPQAFAMTRPPIGADAVQVPRDELKLGH